MARYSVAAALLVLFIAGSVRAVRREGEAFREALRRDRQATRAAAPPERRPPEPPARSTSAAAAIPSATITPGPTSSPPAVASSVVTEPAEPHPPTTAAKAGLDVSKRGVPSLPPPAPGPTPGAADMPPGEDPIWNSPEVKKVWDLSALKTEDEIRLGRSLHALIRNTQPIVENGPMPRRVEDAAEPFLAALSRKGIPYTFTVLDSDAVNAFSHPGGYVYVTSGLLNWIGEDQDYALEFIVAHEMAHVDLDHALTCLKDPGVKKLGLGTLAQFFLLIFPLGYPEPQDFAADRWAYEQMARLQRSRRERLSFLRRFDGYARDNGFENVRGTPRPGPDTSPVDNHLRAHPLVRKRLKQLEALTSSAPAHSR